MFPERTDRVVLDSNDDPGPRRVARQWPANYSVGVEDRFPGFATWAAARDGEYGLGTDAAAVAVRSSTSRPPWTVRRCRGRAPTPRS